MKNLLTAGVVMSCLVLVGCNDEEANQQAIMDGAKAGFETAVVKLMEQAEDCEKPIVLFAGEEENRKEITLLNKACLEAEAAAPAASTPSVEATPVVEEAKEEPTPEPAATEEAPATTPAAE